MKNLLEVSLVALALTSGISWVAAQSASRIPMQKGITVDQPIMHNAVAIAEADKEDAVVVTLTQNRGLYLGVDRTSVAMLPEGIRSVLSARRAQTVYIKADARVPFSSFVEVVDAMRAAGVQRLGLLTAKDSDKPGTLVTPKGLEMLIISTR